MPKHYQKDAFLIFCLLAFVYGYFYQPSGWNGNSRFGLIFAIVQEGRLTIDSYHDQAETQTGDKAFFDGHYYSDKAIGPALAGTAAYLPLYWIKRIFNRIGQVATLKSILTFLVIGIPSAITGSLMYILCLYLSQNRLHAYLVTMAITLGTLYFPFSILFFSHQFSSSLLFSAFLMIFFLSEKPRLWKSWYLFIIGVLLGWVLISEYPTAAIILALVIYYLSIVWRNHTYHQPRSIIMPALGGSILILLQLAYNKLCFGSFLSIGYSNLTDPVFRSAMGEGLMGINWPDLKVLFYMTFHPTMGLFWESPVLLLSIIGAFYMFIKQRYRQEATLALWIISSYLVIMSGYYMWWGGNSFGPRHIIPILPFFCIPLAFVPRRLTLLLAFLSIVSIGQMGIAVASTILIPEKMMLIIDKLSFFGYSNIYNYCLVQLKKGYFAQNLGHILFGLNSWNSLIPLMLGITGLTFTFFWKKNKEIVL